MSSKGTANVAQIRPSGSFLAGLLFLASAAGGTWFEYSATLGYDASQPYDWIIESMSDLGVAYRQIHPLKRYNVSSWRAKTMNFGLMWSGVVFALAHFYLFIRTRKQYAAKVASLRTIRALLAVLFVGGASLMAMIHGGPREKHWNTIGWHWNGFAFMAIAGNLNSVVAGIQAYQVGGLDGNLLYRSVSVLLGIAGLASFARFNTLGEWNTSTQLGLWQRASLYPITAWQAVTGLGLILGWALSSGSKTKRS